MARIDRVRESYEAIIVPTACKSEQAARQRTRFYGRAKAEYT